VTEGVTVYVLLCYMKTQTTNPELHWCGGYTDDLVDFKRAF